MSEHPPQQVGGPIQSHEEAFARLTKVIETWFALLRHTVWFQTVFVGVFGLIGVVFFGINMWDIQRDFRRELGETARLRTELSDKLAALRRDQDLALKSLQLELQQDLRSLDSAYARKLQLVRGNLEKQAKVVLPVEIGTPVYSPSPPR